MTDAPEGQDEILVIRPSLGRNAVYAVTAVVMAGIFLELARSGQTSPLPAILGAIVLVIGAATLLSAHLPDASYLRLTPEGFEIREFRKSTYYRWTEVSPFGLRRRVLGTAIEFAVFPPDGSKPESRTLPAGYTVPVRQLIQTMSEWRQRARPPE